MKSRALKTYVLVLGALLASVFALNSWLDVSGLNTSAEVYRLAGQQSAGDLLVWENLFDQRSWVKSRFEHGYCPDVFVLGSSTVGAFRQEWFGDQTLLNGWLGGPTVEDFEAVTHILLSSGCAPKQIVVGVDHWLLNAKVKDRRWVTVSGDYVAYQRQHGRALLAAQAPMIRWDVFKERLNFVTTLESVTRLWKLLRQGAWPSRPRLAHMTGEDFCKTISSAYYIRSFDGHYTGCPVFTNSPEKVEELARAYVVNNGHQINEWDGVDSERFARLATLLELLHARGSRITMLAQPFHPIVYQTMMDSPKIREHLNAMDEQLSKLADQLGGRYLNLRNPATVGCPPSEFEDSHHSRPACEQKVAARITD